MKPILVALAILLSPLALAQEAGDDPALPPGLGGAEEESVEETQETTPWTERLPEGLHGFLEGRVGPRVRSDPAHSEDFTLGEVRLQAEYGRAWKRVAFDARGDLGRDFVLDDTFTDMRLLRLTVRPGSSFDLQLGRQIVTWGTGDLLFLNDLFPKDWQAFFIGRDEDYLKAPADSLRAGWFLGPVNLDFVYTPQFTPDRYIRGERISFFDAGSGGFRGDAAPLVVTRPDDAFDDDETALRVYGRAGSVEIAGYAYRGFWKSPAGFDPGTMTATFPALDVWGASVRGPLAGGIANAEIGLYDSRDDPRGDDPLVANGELRLLLGYERELARETTGGFQLYVERLLDYGRYLQTLPAGPPRDEDRLVLTTRLTKLLKGQTWIPSLFVYWSPTDGDAYLRPKLTIKRSDHLTFEFGGNLFFGERRHTFFGQFENSSNVYGSIRFAL